MKRIFFNENVWISIDISLKFVPKGPINKIPALVQVMARRRPGDKPLSEPMLISLPTHICVTRPQWVKRGMVEIYSYVMFAKEREQFSQAWKSLVFPSAMPYLSYHEPSFIWDKIHEFRQPH